MAKEYKYRDTVLNKDVILIKVPQINGLSFTDCYFNGSPECAIDGERKKPLYDCTYKNGKVYIFIEKPKP